MTKLDIWELTFDAEENPYGVHGASLVEAPAIEIEAVHFSKEEEFSQIKMASEEQRVVLSPLLIPNKKIYRARIGKDEERGFTFATENTIAKLQQNFFKQDFHHNSSLEHETPIEDVYIFESWIIQDPQKDKSSLYGYDLPKGTWMVAMKIENEEVWNDYIKTGKVKGLSIDALLKPVRVTNNNDNNDKILMKLEKLTIEQIVSNAIKQVAMASEMKEFVISDTLSVYGDLSVDSVLTDKEGNALPNLEFDFEGSKYKTDDMGVIVSVEPIEEEVQEVEQAADPAELETKLAETEAKLAEKEALVLELEAKVATLEEENAKLNEEATVSKQEVVAMKAETPANDGIQTIELAKQTEVPSGTLGALRDLINKNK
jgi:hypothetical protein